MSTPTPSSTSPSSPSYTNVGLQTIDEAQQQFTASDADVVLQIIDEAQQQFTASDADVVLQTVDGAQLRAYRRILIEASPFFRNLFSLPQPLTTDDGVPVVEVTENSTIMKVLLLLVYPGAEPRISTLSEIAELLNVAEKYEMIRATETLRKLLVSPCYIKEEPVRVYAIACCHDFKEEAQLASRYTLSIDALNDPPPEEFNCVFAYYRLLILHRQRSEAARAILDNEEKIACSGCNRSAYGQPKWWWEFVRRAKQELSSRPMTNVIFSFEFLAEVADYSRDECQSCPASMAISFKRLQKLKNRIDDLPSTV